MTEFGLSRGNAVQTFNSAGVQRIIAIFGKEMGIVEDVAREQLENRERIAQEKLNEAERIRLANYRKENDLSNREAEIKRLERKAQTIIKDAKEEADKVREEASKVREEMERVETPEARDRLRLLAIFKNTVDVQTPQNNTMFIAGCASILSGASVGFGANNGFGANKKDEKEKFGAVKEPDFYEGGVNLL